MLYRFREVQRIEAGLGSRFDKRPRFANMVSSLKEAERWRRDLIREITRKIERINDASLTEFQVRDLNDEINKNMHEKRQWEYRVRELGGTDYFKRLGPLDVEGKPVPGTKGYKYYGRAKELPGVKELFQLAAVEEAQVKPEDMMYVVDTDYFGLRDEDDGALLEYERLQEQEFRDAVVGRFGEDGAENLAKDFVLPAQVPTQKEVEAWFVQRRQQELADRYIGSVTA
ncbi:NineTeen Complex (NTC) component [Polyrhizophydium stewartii]|uniref:NineTeen Complex (NTC) component n=1 Tax=Polyrhizophydium stewartii TaxID=2732419 RepID=A0ABR4N685_9FUNG